ncbi:MAG: hypothetical protein P8J18_08335 [Halieaceae bacterium]|nr:hypothetical protein [Halieaceae bacterium]
MFIANKLNPSCTVAYADTSLFFSSLNELSHDYDWRAIGVDVVKSFPRYAGRPLQ